MNEPVKHTLQPSEWLRLYGDYLFSIAMVKLSNRELAEDIVQETFLSAIRAAAGFKGDSSEKTWLTTILNNKIIDQYRKKATSKEITDYVVSTEASFTQHFFETGPGVTPHWLDDTAPQSWDAAADKQLNEKEFQNILLACIHKMPEKLASVFVAKYLDDILTENICKDFSLTSSNYWVIIHRAKVLVRSCLEKNWFRH